MQELQLLAKTVKDQTSYIKELEKKFDCSMVLVKKRKKSAKIVIKKMETIASGLTVLVVTYLKNGLITWNNLSNS